MSQANTDILGTDKGKKPEVKLPATPEVVPEHDSVSIDKNGVKHYSKNGTLPYPV
jgi:hypothetical protein